MTKMTYLTTESVSGCNCKVTMLSSVTVDDAEGALGLIGAIKKNPRWERCC